MPSTAPGFVLVCEEFDVRRPLNPGDEIVIGRVSGCDISISDATVGRRHVRIHADRDHLVLQDLGSSNGTFAAGRVLCVESTRLVAGDVFSVGAVPFRIEASGLRLQPATDADWPEAWEIQRRAFDELVTDTWEGWTEEQVNKCRDAWNPSQTRCLLRDDEMVAWIRVEHRDDHDWLDLMVVSPEAQNAGIGTILMRTVMGEAILRGIPVKLSVYRSNPARRLYARLGFKEHPLDEIRMLAVFSPKN